MTSFQALKHILESIVEIYEPSEAVSIASIVLEDAFGIKPKQISDNQKLTKEQQQELDAIIGSWTAELGTDEVLDILHAAGLPAPVRFS